MMISSQMEIKTCIRKLRRRYSYVFMETALELHYGSFKKWWKGVDIHPADIALLRMLATFPWVIETASERFNKKYAELRLVQAAIERKR